MRSVRLLGAGCLVLTLLVSHTSRAAAPAEPIVYNKVYAVSDLPVYAGKRFDPSILISLMKTTVDPESWMKNAAVSVYRDNLSLVVAQTDENHVRVRRLLDSFRQRADHD